MPPISSSEYIPAMLDACCRYDVRGILSFFDPDVYCLSCHYDEFCSIGVVPVLPRESAATIGFNKLKTFQFLTDLSISVPLTTESLATAMKWLESGKMAFPLVVKPRCGFGSFNTFVAQNIPQLRAFFEYADDMIVQQFVEGVALNVDGLGDLNAKAISVVPWRKILSRLGETERSITIDDPDLVQLGVRLIEEVGIIGPLDADFIQDAGGTLWTLELNTRFGGGYPVSHLAGADFPRLILEMLAGKKRIRGLARYQRGVTMMKKLQVIPGPAAEDVEKA